jgi:ATP-dependent DNA ligase
LTNVEEHGEQLFGLACERDLEGIVAKHRQSRYAVEDHNRAWVKIRNRSYSQLIGRDELFERRYEEKGGLGRVRPSRRGCKGVNNPTQ